MLDHRSDIHIIEAVKNGEVHAFDSLVLRYQARILKVVSRYVRDPSEIFDVCQEVFIKAYRAIDKFRGDSAFYTWLYRIATNTSKNYVITQGRRLSGVDMEMDSLDKFIISNLPKENGTPEKLLMRDQMEHAVYDTINHLPKELRTAILLREMDGLSYEEIAEIMTCPVGTVRSRIFRARAAIDKNVQPLL